MTLKQHAPFIVAALACLLLVGLLFSALMQSDADLKSAAPHLYDSEASGF